MIGIIIPTLGRPAKLASVVANIHEVTKTPHKIYFAVEPEDTESMNAISATGESYIVSDENPGNHTGAANTAYKRTDEPFLIIANDDFLFHLNWDIEALKAMENPAIGVVGLNEMSGADRCITIFLIRRKYIEEQSGCVDVPNVVFYPGYNHQFVDNELWETAERRRAFVICPTSHVEHMHPGFGKAPKDATYNRADSKASIDQETYRSRRHLWA